jgi:hypothetical protein
MRNRQRERDGGEMGIREKREGNRVKRERKGEKSA